MPPKKKLGWGKKDVKGKAPSGEIDVSALLEKISANVSV
jgi:hypothetical protein